MSCIYGSESRNAFNHTHKLKYTFRPLTQITADSPKKCWVTVWSGRMWNTLFSNTICSNAPILCTTANKERFSFSYWTVKLLSIWLFIFLHAMGCSQGNSFPAFSDCYKHQEYVLCWASVFHILLTLEHITLFQRSWYFAAILCGFSVILHHSNENLDTNKRIHLLKCIHTHFIKGVQKKMRSHVIFLIHFGK